MVENTLLDNKLCSETLYALIAHKWCTNAEFSIIKFQLFIFVIPSSSHEDGLRKCMEQSKEVALYQQEEKQQIKGASPGCTKKKSNY